MLLELWRFFPQIRWQLGVWALANGRQLSSGRYVIPAEVTTRGLTGTGPIPGLSFFSKLDSKALACLWEVALSTSVRVLVSSSSSCACVRAHPPCQLWIIYKALPARFPSYLSLKHLTKQTNKQGTNLLFWFPATSRWGLHSHKRMCQHFRVWTLSGTVMKCEKTRPPMPGVWTWPLKQPTFKNCRAPWREKFRRGASDVHRRDMQHT